jgi:hypothetical protein
MHREEKKSIRQAVLTDLHLYNILLQANGNIYDRKIPLKNSLFIRNTVFMPFFIISDIF